jgi:hypothetical protein
MIFVHEFVTGGGWPETAPLYQHASAHMPPASSPLTGLAAEGLAMLRAVLADLRAWGRFRTLSTLDRRLQGWSLPADEVNILTPGDYAAAFPALLARAQAVLIIAPESEGILARLSAQVEARGLRLLGSSAAAVRVAADKWRCDQRFRQAGLPTPETWRLTADVAATAAPALARKVGWPLVVKPIDGVGCEGTSLVWDAATLTRALDHPRLRPELLLQRYVPGTHASVSLLVTAGEALPLSLNGQTIHMGLPCRYHGGVTPLEHPQARDALELARQAVTLIPGLKGYVGVDLVLSDQGPTLIEINPRLTTAYIGVRQVVNVNLAQAIWQACCQNILPEQIMLSGMVSFGNGQHASQGTIKGHVIDFQTGLPSGAERIFDGGKAHDVATH